MKNKSVFRRAAGLLGTMLVNLIMCILVVMVTFSLPFMDNIYGTILAQLVNGLVFYAMIYGSLWTDGNDDRVKISAGHIKYDRLKGFKIGFLASVIYLIMNILLLLSKASLIFDVSATYKIINAHIWPLLDRLTATGNEAAPMLFAVDYQWYTILIGWAAYALIIVLAGIGYIMGTKDISFKTRIVYKNK